MRENLRATKFKDGTSLVYQRSATDDQKSQTVYLNEYSTGTQYQKAAMYDYYKKDDSFDVESQSDEVKKRYGLHYNFSAVAGDYDPYVQNLGSDYNILSQDIEGQTNNSLCPEGRSEERRVGKECRSRWFYAWCIWKLLCRHGIY